MLPYSGTGGGDLLSGVLPYSGTGSGDWSGVLPYSGPGGKAAAGKGSAAKQTQYSFGKICYTLCFSNVCWYTLNNKTHQIYQYWWNRFDLHHDVINSQDCFLIGGRLETGGPDITGGVVVLLEAALEKIREYDQL